MQNDLKHQHLAFLLSLGAMPLAGCTVGDDDDTNATTQATTVSTTVGTSDTDPSTTLSTSDPTAETSNSTTVSTTAGTDATGDTGTTDPTGGTDPDGTGTTGEIPATCALFADHYVECLPDYARYHDQVAAGCAESLAYYEPYGAECVGAADDFFACLTAIDCPAFIDKEDDCVAETAALMEACPVVGTSSGSSGSSGG
jgi:hypothetical protein